MEVDDNCLKPFLSHRCNAQTFLSILHNLFHRPESSQIQDFPSSLLPRPLGCPKFSFNHHSSSPNHTSNDPYIWEFKSVFIINRSCFFCFQETHTTKSWLFNLFSFRWIAPLGRVPHLQLLQPLVSPPLQGQDLGDIVYGKYFTIKSKDLIRILSTLPMLGEALGNPMISLYCRFIFIYLEEIRASCSLFCHSLC